MKNFLLFLFLTFFINCYCQDILKISKVKAQIFSLSPISKKVSAVNGLCLGVGHYPNKFFNKQTVNGLNLEADPIGFLAPFILLYASENKNSTEYYFDNRSDAEIKINGINISTGGFIEGAELNGFNITTMTSMSKMNGVSFSGFLLISENINGIAISGIENYSKNMNGLSISLLNKTFDLSGMQIGLYNSVDNKMIGVQIGLVNISNKTKGLQIGLINRNKKRTLPFLNF